MAMSHRADCVYGIQFHPESVLTDMGEDLLKNFVQKQDENHLDSLYLDLLQRLNFQKLILHLLEPHNNNERRFLMIWKIQVQQRRKRKRQRQ